MTEIGAHLEARAKIQWASDRRAALQAELDRFLATKPCGVAEGAHPAFPGFRVYTPILRTPLPHALQIDAGVILKAYRESLDYLAVGLAEANGTADPRDVAFPIAGSEAEFLAPNTQRKIVRLKAEDQTKIRALKPYQGGVNAFFLLNQMANEDKHRRLVALIPRPRSLHATGDGYVRRMEYFTSDNVHTPGTAFAILDGDPGTRLELDSVLGFPDHRFEDAGVGAVLHMFEQVVSRTLDQF